MRAALLEARLALSEGEIPVGAVMTMDGRIIGRGHNKRSMTHMPFAHAEMAAISTAGNSTGLWRFDGCTLYVTLEPCPMCAGAIVQTRVHRVVYGTRDPKAGAAGSLYDILRDPRMSHRCAVTGGVLGAECEALIHEFFRSRRSSKQTPPHAS
jgi:tRNA(adenine34) deaminase